ncbi:mCG147125 [Mus musculus]|nr:mCG147125 [Mus musculus]
MKLGGSYGRIEGRISGPLKDRSSTGRQSQLILSHGFLRV